MRIAADTRRVNAFIEERVREMPEQYYWLHKRFATRLHGEQRYVKRCLYLFMQRIPEPELMTDSAQVQAYTEADFSVPRMMLSSPTSLCTFLPRFQSRPRARPRLRRGG